MATTVIVASKLPHGLVLQLQEAYTETEYVMGGGARDVERHKKVGETVTINGCARHMDRPSDIPMNEGYALTYGVDAEFFNKWLEQHADFPPVANGFIFAHDSRKGVDAEIKNAGKIKSGLEPIDPSDLPEEFEDQSVTKAA